MKHDPSRAANATHSSLLEMFDRLFGRWGPQHWWPAESDVEIVVGAILTQNTAWTNVERAIANLRAADGLSWTTLRDLAPARLSELIRPAGTYRLKTKRLKAFVATLWNEHAGSLDRMMHGELDAVRARLLAIHGIGPETADAILLYVGRRPAFVVDAYTQRVLRRHLLTDARATYESTRQLVHDRLPADPELFNEFHAMFVAVGKAYCRPKARCAECPLRGMPHDESL